MMNQISWPFKGEAWASDICKQVGSGCHNLGNQTHGGVTMYNMELCCCDTNLCNKQKTTSPAPTKPTTKPPTQPTTKPTTKPPNPQPTTTASSAATLVFSVLTVCVVAIISSLN